MMSKTDDCTGQAAPRRDYEQLSAELVRAWRGKRTRAAFSRRLGSKGGMVHNWEAKRRWPTAARALWAAERSGVDVCDSLRTFYGQSPVWMARIVPTTPEGVVAFLRDWAGTTSTTDIARRVERSRHSVARWLSGKSEPRLPDFLRLVEALSVRLVDFVSTLADPRSLPSVADEWKQLATARSLAYEAPWSHAVLRALDLEQYRAAERHDEKILANALRLPASRVRHCLQLLESAGQVELRDAHYVGCTASSVDTRQDPAANRRLKQWWSEVGLERLREGVEGQFMFNVFSVSSRDLERIKELQLRYFRELRGIIAQSEPSERVGVINLQLLDLGAPPSSRQN